MCTYFVGRSVSETGEEREESARNRGPGGVSEDNFVEVRCGLDLRRGQKRHLCLDTVVAVYLANIAHQPLRRGVDRMEDHELRDPRAPFTY
jgi:hypothetical protein